MAQNLNHGDDIPDENHVVRYCSPQHVTDGTILQTAFELRKSEECCSTNWLEFCNGNSNLDRCLNLVCGDMARETRKNGRFAKIAVGSAKRNIAEKYNQDISIKYSPTNESKSHADICPYRQKGGARMCDVRFRMALWNEIAGTLLVPNE